MLKRYNFEVEKMIDPTFDSLEKKFNELKNKAIEMKEQKKRFYFLLLLLWPCWIREYNKNIVI